MSPSTKSTSPWSKTAYIRGIKFLRQFFTGYLGREGYDLRKNPAKTLTSYEKKKIRTQVSYIDEILSGVPKRIYRARSRKVVREIMHSQGVKFVPRNLKVAFIPIVKKETKIRSIKSKKVVGFDNLTGKAVVLVTMAPYETVTMKVRRRYMNIDPKFLINATVESIRDAMELADADLYTIQAGIHEITEGEFKLQAGATDKEINWTIDRLIKKYSVEGQNNHWKEWLGGLVAYYYPHQSDYDIYRNAVDQKRMKNAEKRKKYRVSSKRRNAKEIAQEKQEKAVEKALIKDRIFQKKRISKEITVLKREIAEFIAEGVVTRRDKKILGREKKRLLHLREIRDSIK